MPKQQSNPEARPRSAHNLTQDLPSDLGELVPVDSFFNRYVTLLGAGQQAAASGQGPPVSGPSMQSQGSSFSGQQGQPGQPSFRYPTTANYLAQLTGQDLHKQVNQVRSSLPVEQLDTSMQHRHLNGRGPQAPSPTAAQGDVLAYPSSSLAHFQQLLQAQAATGLSPQQLDAQHHTGLSQFAAVQAAQHAAQQAQHAQHAASQQQQWLLPKAAEMTPPSHQSSPSPNQSDRNPNRSGALSPSRYGSSRRMPGPSADSPKSWAQQQQDPKGAGPRAGAGGVASTLGAPGGTQEEGSDMEDEGHSTGSRMPSGTLSRSNRTPRQQLQNKQAQQRYRERRKMKVCEMEQALAAMSQQVEELQGVMKQNVALQDKTLKLEQMLADRDVKIEQLTGQLKAASSATSAAPPSVPNQDMASGPSEEGGRTLANSTFDGMSDLKLEFQGQIMKLQQYIEANNLRHVDPLGSSVPQEVLAHVTDMVEDGCRVCRRVQAEGIQVLSLITCEPHSMTEVATTQEREKWAAAVRAIRLSPLQVEQVLIWRQEHLSNMLAVYEQRQQLNAQAMGRMQPETRAGGGGAGGGVPVKRLEGLQMDGYLPTAKANLELTGALDKVKENLRWEQRTVLQFNWVLVNRIMTPIQTALFMVHAWPSHCDCLALVNTVSAMKHDIQKPAPGTRGSPSSQQSTPLQPSMTDPMQTHPHQSAITPQGSPSQPSHSLLVEGLTSYSQSQAQGPLTSQVNPFASAFRPVLPSKRDSSSLNRSPLSPSKVSASQVSPAFQPGSSPPPSNPALQAQLSASLVQLSEAPQSADSVDGTGSAATANGAS